jgi:hypothetical protein
MTTRSERNINNLYLNTRNRIRDINGITGLPPNNWDCGVGRCRNWFTIRTCGDKEKC